MVDFFAPDDERCYQTSAPVAWVFDEASAPSAEMRLENTTGLGARVDNEACRQIVFRPVDRVLYRSSDGPRCDALIHTADKSQLHFIELKCWHEGGWFSHGVEQLEHTIGDFQASHGDVLQNAICRRAYVINTRKRKFNLMHSDAICAFVRRTHIPLRTMEPIAIR